MKQYLSAGVMLVFSLLLTSCSYTQYPNAQSDIAKETWQREINTDQTKWASGADHWFLTGEPNATEVKNRNAPPSAGITTRMVSVPDFTRIQTNGIYQVQIFGSTDHNSVFVYGAKPDVRNTLVRVGNNTLYLDQRDKNRRSTRNVIVRIGVMNLTQLKQFGNGSVEVIRVQSNSLDISSAGCGDIYLTGVVNLKQVSSTNSGSITVFGVKSPQLDIRMGGTGSINLSGNIGIHSITHRGSGNVNIVGANSDSLTIDTAGRGKIGIKGIVNLKEVKAKDAACVYIDQIYSPCTNIYAFDYARVGLSGYVRELNVFTYDRSKFFGRDLVTDHAYVRATDMSHVNISARNKIFASATKGASIYFYGEPKILSKFQSDNATVIPVWSGSETVSEVDVVKVKSDARAYKYDAFNMPRYK